MSVAAPAQIFIPLLGLSLKSDLLLLITICLGVIFYIYNDKPQRTGPIMKKHFIFFAIAIITTITATQAQVPLSGYFIAREECGAMQSIRRQTNPGNIITRLDQAYQLKAKNRPAASHYLIKMDAEPQLRWVATHCGEHVVPVDAPPPTPVPIPPPIDVKDTKYILAISWQPGFCETRPTKPECLSQTEDRFDATHFTLHGLWPQPRKNVYCRVAPSDVTKDKNGNWQSLPDLTLEEETRNELNLVMPGTQSFLHRHEWIKHGTCYNDESADTYYKKSLELMRTLNRADSAVKNLFSNNIGMEINSEQIAEAFEDTFGDGARNKIKIACKSDNDRRLITEITIGLQGDLNQISMSDAILSAPNANNIGCSGGIVDPVGLQ